MRRFFFFAWAFHYCVCNQTEIDVNLSVILPGCCPRLSVEVPQSTPTLLVLGTVRSEYKGARRATYLE